MASLTDPKDVASSTPCTCCNTTSGRKVEWTDEEGGRVTLCRACFYRVRAAGNDADTIITGENIRLAAEGNQGAETWEIEDTAGGCNAYMRDFPTLRMRVLITGYGAGCGYDEDASNIPETATEHCYVGVYGLTPDGGTDDLISEHNAENLAAALEWLGIYVQLAAVGCTLNMREPWGTHDMLYVTTKDGKRLRCAVADLPAFLAEMKERS